MGRAKDFFSGIYNLTVGLFVTGKHLGRHAITLQYPKERWEMPERSRGVVVLLSDPETGELNCTACLLCMKACPVAAIKIEREKNENKRWEPTVFEIDNTICCFCGLCEESCNFDAIKLTGKYEFSVYDQSKLIYDLDRLTGLGKDVKYTPRKKKKPAAKKPAPKTDAKSSDEPTAEKADKAAAEDVKKAARNASGDKPSEKPKSEEKTEKKQETAESEEKKPDNKKPAQAPNPEKAEEEKPAEEAPGEKKKESGD